MPTEQLLQIRPIIVVVVQNSRYVITQNLTLLRSFEAFPPLDIKYGLLIHHHTTSLAWLIARSDIR